MGSDSVAGIPTNGKVDEDWEILLNIYATAYDAINNDTMLTHTPGVYDEATIQEVNGRFLVLRRLAAKYAPHLKKDIDKIYELTIKNMKGQLSDKELLKELRKIVRKHGVPEDILNQVEMKIDMAESYPKFDIAMPKLDGLFSTKKAKPKNSFKVAVPKFDIDLGFGLNSAQKPKKQPKQKSNNPFD